MSFNKRIDKNQPTVVKAFRSAGASVGHTHAVGKGFPDIVVGLEGLTLVGNYSKKKVLELLSGIRGLRIIEGANLLVEIKDDTQPLSKRKLTPDEVEWHEKWKGQIVIISNETEAIELVS